MSPIGTRHALHLLYSHYESDPRPRRMAEALRDAGWKVTVFSLGKPDEPRNADVDGVHTVAWGTGRYRGGAASAYLSAYLRFSMWAASEVARQRGRFQFVHVHAPPDFLAFSALPVRWGGAGSLLDVHDPTPELFAERFGTRRSVIMAGAKMSERWSARAADHVLVVNEQVRERLITRGIPPGKISVILNLPDERIFWRDTLPAPPPRPVLAYHGTLVPQFGPQVLLEVAALLIPEFPDLRVRILGDGDLKPTLLSRAAEPDLAGRVEISPARVPVHRIPDELGAVTAGVVANRTQGFSRLVLPTKLLEYLALGIPAVATRTDPIAHYFNPGELATVDRPDPVAIAAELRTLIRDPAFALHAVTKARRFFERHSWKQEREAYVALVDRLSSRRR